jgi:hypothetical protein
VDFLVNPNQTIVLGENGSNTMQLTRGTGNLLALLWHLRLIVTWIF